MNNIEEFCKIRELVDNIAKENDIPISTTIHDKDGRTMASRISISIFNIIEELKQAQKDSADE